MAIVIKKAVKFGAKLRLALYGPSGSGKTYTALSIAREMAGDKRVCVIDTERGSASKYADEFDFDVIELDSFHPNSYIEAIKAVVQTGEYSVLVIDSASHEWEGSKGALELAGRDFTNWANVTPLHNKFIDAMLIADIHVIATMRAKEEHVMEQKEVAGKLKNVVSKKGMEPVQRKGMQYEFDIVGALDMENSLTIEKTRCSRIKGMIVEPGHEVEIVTIVQAWLDGVARVPTAEEIYERGVTKGTWTKQTFFASASAILDTPVHKENVKTLDAGQLAKLNQAIDTEPAEIAS